MDIKTRDVSSYQLVLDEFVCFYQLFCHLCCKILAHFASLLTWQSLQFLFHSLLSSRTIVESIQWLELHFILFYHLSLLYSCRPHQTCTRIRNWTSLLLGAFRVLGIWNFKNKQQNPRNTATPRNPTHSNGNFWMSRSSVQFQFLIGCFKHFFEKECEYVKLYCTQTMY